MRQMEIKEVIVGDRKFYIKPFAAFTTARLSGELSSFLAPVLGGFAGMASLFSGDSDTESAASRGFDINTTNIEDIVPLISAALSDIHGDKLEWLMKELIIKYQNVSYDDTDIGKTVPLSFDAANEMFCCEIQDMFMLCYEVIKVNFGGFFEKTLPRFGLRLKGAATENSQKNTENSTQGSSQT